jgi:hypothetical protein
VERREGWRLESVACEGDQKRRRRQRHRSSSPCYCLGDDLPLRGGQLYEDAGELVAKRLTGDDSPLTSVWEEICVQVQGEESFYWEAYLETIDQYASSLVTPLSSNQKRALWLQTQEGLDRLRGNDRESDAANVPFDDLAIAELIRDRVLGLAGSYSNHRIDRCLEAGSELDRG